MPKRTDHSLTAAFCRSAKPIVRLTGARPQFERVAYPDRDVRGLELRVAASGDKTWAFRYRDAISGKQSRVTLGVFDPTVDEPAGPDGVGRRLTLHGARVAARALRAKVDAGADPAAEKRQARFSARARTIKSTADLAAAYFLACETGAYRGPRRRKKAQSTLAGERWLWGKYLEPRVGQAPFDGYSRAQIRSVLREVYDQAPSQSNKCRALLSQLFNYALDEELIGTNPVARVAKLTEESVRTRTLSHEELRVLWRGLEAPSALRIVAEGRDEPVLIGRPVCIAIALCLFTLQRRAEVTGMRRRELDLASRSWVIPADRAKGRAEHLVPLSAPAVALIREALALQAGRGHGESEFVFPSPRSRDLPMQPGALSHAMADLTAALRIEDATLHDLRRTGATGIAALGAPPFVVSKVLAHKDGGGGSAITARHYNLYAYADEKRAALDRWAATLETLLELAPAAAAAGEPAPLGAGPPPAAPGLKGGGRGTAR